MGHPSKDRPTLLNFRNHMPRGHRASLLCYIYNVVSDYFRNIILIKTIEFLAQIVAIYRNNSPVTINGHQKINPRSNIIPQREPNCFVFLAAASKYEIAIM
jgi:hypothetical protein